MTFYKMTVCVCIFDQISHCLDEHKKLLFTNINLTSPKLLNGSVSYNTILFYNDISKKKKNTNV